MSISQFRKATKLNHTSLVFLILGFSLFLGPDKQTQPTKIMPHFAYIDGNDTIQAFYISKYEATNWEYLVYLKWLKTVFAFENSSPKYSKIYFDAIPDTSTSGDLLWNPEYSCYPVVGVNWKQAYIFCQWLSDRMNEYILWRKGILHFDPKNQLVSEHFTTETYLAEQYIGLVAENMFDPELGAGRSVKWKDRILLSAIRLPTEYEWKYAEEINQAGKVHSNKTKLNDKRYFRKHFLYIWYKYYLKNIDTSKLAGMSIYEGPFINYYLNNYSSSSYYPHERVYINHNIQPIKNLEGNVSEWVYDGLDSRNSSKRSNLLSVFQSNGQPNVNDINGKFYNEEGNEIFKSELGRLPYRIVCEDNNGMPVYIREMSIQEPNCLKDTKNEKYRIVCGDSFNSQHVNRLYYLHQDSSRLNIGFRYVQSHAKMIKN